MSELRKCHRCLADKPLTDFSKTRRATKNGFKEIYYPYCKPCRVTLNRLDEVKHPVRVRRNRLNSKLRTNYGITPEDRKLQLDHQSGKCAICGTSLLERSPQSVHIDHCHSTKKLRGILCGPCNTGIGSFRDNVMSLYRAIEYIQQNGVWLCKVT